MDQRPYSFEAAGDVMLRIATHFSLPEKSQATGDFKILLGAESGSANFYAFPSTFENFIESKNPINVQKPASGAMEKSAFCASFTIVPAPVAPTCNGFNNGIAAVLVPTNGVGPYAYQWVGGPQTRQWFNRGAGTYTVIVLDLGQGGIPCNLNVFVNEPGPLTVFSMNASTPLCADVCNGTAAPLVIGGNGGYSFTWSSGEVGFTASALCPVFTLNIEDIQGCTYDTTYIFPNPPDTIQFIATINPVVCNGDGDGSIGMSITGGVGNFAVSWTGPSGFSSVSQNISGLIPGTYTITAEDDNGCLATENFTISENPPIIVSSTQSDNLCANGNVGSINLTLTGGAAPYDISWIGPGGFASLSEDLSGLASGIYDVSAVDAGGCAISLQVEILEPSEILISFVTNNVSCFDGNSGSITALTSGGFAPFTFTWSGPDGFTGSGSTITNLEVGNYIVITTDGNGCTMSDSTTITSPPELTAGFTTSPLTCQGGNNASIVLAVTGGLAPYSFAWTGPAGFSSTAQNISGLGSGTYTVIITDANNCALIANLVISSTTPIGVSGTTVPASCLGSGTGAISITLMGGQAPYSFAWNGPIGFASSNQNITGLISGTYNVLVTDANGCQASASFNVSGPANLTATFTTTSVLCFGAATGSITTTPSGGTPPYTYLWIGPGGTILTTQSISNVLAGEFTLQLTDANNCQSFLDVEITQRPPFNITRVVTHATCFNGSNGAIQLNVSGATPGFTYAWTGPAGFTATTRNISGLLAGTYVVNITDANGCVTTRTYTVNQPLQITVGGVTTGNVCAGENDGSIDLSVLTGAGPFTYAWSGPAGFTSNTQDITNLIAGNYTVVVTNSQGCTGTAIYVISENPVITISENISNISCFGATDGSIAISVQGGVAPYGFLWAGPNGFSSTMQNITGLAVGNYILNITDAGGCGVQFILTIMEPGELTIVIAATNITCFGDADGELLPTISGGSAPFSYLWSGPNGFTSASEILTGLEAGTYTLNIADAAGCIAEGSAVISESDILMVVVNITQPECLSDNGVLVASATGGTVAIEYAFSWFDELGNLIGTSSTIGGLAPGDYEIVVTDDNGCTASQVIELTRDAFNVSASLTNSTCVGANDGSVTVTPISGTAPFTYSWSGPNGFTASTSAISSLSPGAYELQVTDGTGCIINLVYDIADPVAISLNPLVVPESCDGIGNGSISLNIIGGQPAYLIEWAGPDGFTANTAFIGGLVAGNYDLSVTDLNGCVVNDTIAVSTLAAINLSLSGINTACFGGLSGEITSSVSGGTAPYDYQWSGDSGFSSTAENIAGLAAGTYILALTDANGCQVSDSLEIIDAIEIIVDILIQNATCLTANGSAQANAIGGQGVFSFSWLDGGGTELSTTENLTNVVSGIYTLEVTDGAGCVVIETVVITDVNGTIDASMNPVSCFGFSDGAIDITVNGGLSPYTYSWSSPGGFASTDEDIAGLVQDTYNVVVTDANGCIYAASFDLLSAPELTASANMSSVTCLGGDGSISLLIQGGTAPFDINWTGPDGFSGAGATVSNLEIGMYNYEIIDANGCAFSGSSEVLFNPDIQVTETITPLLCGGASTGSIALDVTGGTAPYNYLWNGPGGFTSIDEDLTDLSEGIYTLVLNDALGCEVTFDYDLTAPDPIVVSFDIVQPDCTIDNGSITAVITGGTIFTDYFITWTDADGNFISFVPEASNLAPGVYTLEVSDANGCESISTVVLTNPGIDVVVESADVSCNGDINGFINLEISGVAEPYTVAWTGPFGYTADQEDISDLVPGNYQYHIVGADSCEAFGIVLIDEPGLLEATPTVINVCPSQSTGSIALAIAGGTEPYIILWAGPDAFTSSDANINGLGTGAYQLLITDANGCTFEAAYGISVNPEILVVIASEPISCFGETDGALSASVEGGIAPYTISWIGPDGFTSADTAITGLGPGIYEFTVTDAAGCTAISQTELTAPQALEISSNVQAAGCESPGSLGSIMLIVSGGQPAYNVLWNGPGGFSASDLIINDLIPGIYEYEVTDGGNCVTIGEVIIIMVDPILLEADITGISCFGLSDGGISISASGGLAPYTYEWRGPIGFVSNQEVISELGSGTYILTLSDSAGCQLTWSGVVTEPSAIVIATSTIDATCNTSADGQIGILPEGGTPPYMYSWTGPNGWISEDQNLIDILPGTYALELTDANGCMATAEASIGFAIEIIADAGADQIICLSSLPATLSGNSTNSDVFYWFNMAGDTLSNSNDLNLFLTAGTYEFIYEAGNGFCRNTDTISVTLPERPDVDAGPDIEVFAEEMFTLGGSPTSTTSVSFAWSPQAFGNFNATAANPSGYLLESMELVVTVTDGNGCMNSDTVFVNVLPEIQISSGFTPNGDGTNDTWVIDNMELFPNNVVSIFNRWGTVVYQTAAYRSDNAWDGTYEGNPVPVGTYYYTIELHDNRFPKPFTGPITIYR